MPTTRSQGRHEPLQHLETPPKRQRKQRSRRPAMAHINPEEPRMRTLSMSPELQSVPNPSNEVAIIPPPVALYTDQSTQTEDVVILTKAEAADLRDRATASVSHKRIRDDESDDEPTAKRHQFSTPQNTKPNNLWMFGERVNGDHPRTAPSKPLGGTPLRRPMRGPLSRRINPTDIPRFRMKNSTSVRPVTFDNVKPIESEVEKQDNSVQEAEPQTTEENTNVQSHSQSQAPQTPRRGLFGSLRGIVHKGWDIAASFSPLTKAEVGPSEQAASNQISYPQLEAEDEGVSMEEYDSEQDRQHRSAERLRPQQSSQYDHLHYIPADTESVDKAMNGEIEPPHQAPNQPSSASRLKAQNPQLSDATIESILKKRERKAALEEERYGPRPTAEESNVAPLFGPDSHYARGTVDPRFLPATPLYGPSKKRKLESVNEPKAQTEGFGFDEESDNIEDENTNQPPDVEQDDIDIPPAKRQKAQAPTSTRFTVPATPRSAMKKPGMNGSIGRKSVAFGQSVSRDIRGHYGPAGQYKGSTFADELPDDSRSLSSIDQNDVISPTTRLNTITNSVRKSPSAFDNLGASIPVIDFTLRDPNDKAWRPSLGNPRPGAFRVPDVDEEDPDESMSDDPPEQPQTPRMSHAELPGASTPLGNASFNESSIVHESTELALDKARSRAEKYKPKSSSRLSEVSRARSRSTSPNSEEDEQSFSDETEGRAGSTASAIQPIGVPPKPFTPLSLDNTTKGTDGLTDHQREHQFDEWAANLNWDMPQTYEDAGTGTKYIHNLIRKNWTEDDSQRSESFWAREFEEVDRAMQDAKGKGQRLTLVTGMEDIESY